MAARPGGEHLPGSRLKIAILGAGSIGCFVGGCWQAAGLPVRFIGRPSFARDIANHGLTLTDYDGWQATLAPGEVDYVPDPAGLGEADIIALTVKSLATAETAREIARHGRDGATVVSLQNGVSNVDLLERELGGRFAIVRGMVPYNVAYLGEGWFHKGVAGRLWTEDQPAMRDLAERVGASPAGLNLSDDMLAIAWGKLLINLNNAINALSGRTLVEELGDRDYRRVFAASMREGLRLLDRARIAPAKVGSVGPRLLPAVIDAPNWLFNNIFMKAWRIDTKARSSMADDLAAGRLTEVDYLNGELVRLAGQLGTEAPVNRRVAELVRTAETGDPRRWDGAELARVVLGG
ncbi:MAG TPA: 2-dehydropantoate 2-reductase [Sphingomicrobium sp.]|nr:2-dehydropantoate 2-reductase [Sphingomicrobium sp.]